MKTQIVAYKGHIGIIAPDGTPQNFHFDSNGIFLVSSAKLADVEASKEAVDLLKTFPKSTDETGNLFLDVDEEGEKTVVWVGGYKVVMAPQESKIMADFDLSELSVAEMEVPQEFKDFVDNEKD